MVEVFSLDTVGKILYYCGVGKNTNSEDQAVNYTKAELDHIFSQAEKAACKAATLFFKNELGGQDGFPCGFAWVNVYGVRGNTKLGRLLSTVNGVRKNTYERAFQLWNPSTLPIQNMDAKYEGARAAAAVLKNYGFDAVASSRMD